MYTVWYGATSLVFGILLFFPVRKLMLAMSINKLQRRENREATEEEKARLKKKVTPIAAAIAVTFAFIYNKVIMLKLMGPAGP
jgi:hypothetical protein